MKKRLAVLLILALFVFASPVVGAASDYYHDAGTIYTEGDFQYARRPPGLDEYDLLGNFFNNGCLLRYIGNAEAVEVPALYAFHDDRYEYQNVGLCRYSFAGNNTLKQVDLPVTVIFIDDRAFADCTSLETFALHNEPALAYKPTLYWFRIFDYVFENCTSLKHFDVPEGTSILGDGVFSGCSNLTSVTIPATVQEIGKDLFVGCSPDLVVTAPAGSYAAEYLKALRKQPNAPKIVITGEPEQDDDSQTGDAVQNTPQNTPQTTAPKNGTVTEGGKLRLYKNGKRLTGTTLATVGGKTYALKSGVVQKATQKAGLKLVKLGKKSYIVNTKGVVQKAKNGKLLKVGKKRYIVNKQGVVQTAKKKYTLVKAGKKRYIVNKQGVVQVKKKALKVGKAVYKTNAAGVAKKQ